MLFDASLCYRLANDCFIFQSNTKPTPELIGFSRDEVASYVRNPASAHPAAQRVSTPPAQSIFPVMVMKLYCLVQGVTCLVLEPPYFNQTGIIDNPTACGSVVERLTYTIFMVYLPSPFIS